MEGLSSFDTHILTWLAAHRVPYVTAFIMFLTQHAWVVAVLGVSGCVVAILHIRRHHAALVGFIGALGLVNVIVMLLKAGIDRPRPLAYELYSPYGESFPSGHTADAVVLFGFVAFLIFHLAPKQWKVPGVILAWAAALFVAYTRLYLGVHYLSDVVAGASIGFICLSGGVILARHDFSHLTKQQQKEWINQ
jgi:undecaprenyl-diphosphatase